MSATAALAPDTRPALRQKFLAATSPRDRWGEIRFNLTLSLAHRFTPILVRYFPVFRYGRIFIITRYGDAILALSEDMVFATPFKKKMLGLDANGEVSLLGFNATEDNKYQLNLSQVMRSLPMDQLPSIASDVAEMTRNTLADRRQVDAVMELLAPATLHVAQKFFGMDFDDPHAFHEWSMVISNYCFAGPNRPDRIKIAARAAAQLIDLEMPAKIQKVLAAKINPGRTVLERLCAATTPQAMTMAQIQATLKSLFIGILPNIPMAGYNILRVLMKRPEAMRIAHAAAVAHDDAKLSLCLLEALRFRPLLAGIFRVCVAPGGVAVGPNGWRQKHIPQNADVMILNIVAMFDDGAIKDPFVFDPGRPMANNLAFGHGRHWCVGTQIALKVLTGIFGPLLRQGIPQPDKTAPPTQFFIGFFAQNQPVILTGSKR